MLASNKHYVAEALLIFADKLQFKIYSEKNCEDARKALMLSIRRLTTKSLLANRLGQNKNKLLKYKRLKHFRLSDKRWRITVLKKQNKYEFQLSTFIKGNNSVQTTKGLYKAKTKINFKNEFSLFLLFFLFLLHKFHFFTETSILC